MKSQKTWFITGAGRGLGRALTLAVLHAGDRVVASVRGDHDLPEHRDLTVLTLDVRDQAAAQRAVQTAAARHDRLDVLINNAGYGLIGAAEEVSDAEARAIIDTNLLGPLWLSQAVIPIMREQGGGDIVQVSTVGAVGTMPFLGLYNASKWGLEGFSEAMSAEVRRFGIRVSIIQPGGLDTDWAGASMQFATPIGAYDAQRSELFGTAEVPWPQEEPAGGMAPDAAARAILDRVASPRDDRLRILVGEDAPVQVKTALNLRERDYARDERYTAAQLPE